MPDNAAAARLRDLLPSIMQQWEERVRAEVPAARDETQIVLHDSLTKMLEVMAKVLENRTDPRTAARDLDFMVEHGDERAAIDGYTLEQMILECQILQEVVLDYLEPEELLDHRDRSIVLMYLGEVIRVAAGEYARAEQQVHQDYSEKLKRADEGKDRFLAMVGHELRNPLSAISNAAKLIEMYAGGQEKLNKPVTIISRQVRHTARLVEDLLDVTRISHGKLALRKERLDVAAAVRRAADVAQSQMDDAGCTFSVATPAGPVWTDGDATRLDQILGNLLNNAARYSEPGGIVSLSLSRRDGEAVIEVKDTGRGITPEALPHIFDLFVQEENPLSRSHGGLGIGLSLVRMLVEMHGWRVEAASPGRGLGSIFSVYLPDAAELACEITPASDNGTLLRVQPQSILVIDDNVDAAQTLADILELWGHTVRLAHDAASAAEASRHDPPDVVLLDLGLPGTDGVAVARALRTTEGLERVRIVALTGYGSEADRRRTREAGFDDHLVKPVDLDHLKRVLAGLAA